MEIKIYSKEKIDLTNFILATIFIFIFAGFPLRSVILSLQMGEKFSTSHILFLLIPAVILFLTFSSRFFSFFKQQKLNKFFTEEYKRTKKIKLQLIEAKKEISFYRKRKRRAVYKTFFLFQYNEYFFESETFNVSIPKEDLKLYSEIATKNQDNAINITAYLMKNETYYVKFEEIQQEIEKKINMKG